MTPAQIESWDRTLNELGARQRQVIDVLSHHPQGLSAWQIAEITGRLVHAVRPRLTELQKAGLVRAAGERLEAKTERREAVWVVTPFETDGQMRMAI